MPRKVRAPILCRRTEDPATPDGGTLTVRLDDGTGAALAALSEKAGRPPEEIAAEAIAAHVAREARIVAIIEEGIADIEAGRVVPHEEVMREARQIIEAARERRRIRCDP